MNAWYINAGPSEWEKKVQQYEKPYKASSHMDFLPFGRRWTCSLAL